MVLRPPTPPDVMLLRSRGVHQGRAESEEYEIHRIQDPATLIDEYRLDDVWRFMGEGKTDQEVPIEG